jgi:rubrerythrin
MTTSDTASQRIRQAREDFTIHATTSNEAQAAAIAQRLIDEEGRNATTRDIADLEAEGHSVRSAHTYAVVVYRDHAEEIAAVRAAAKVAAHAWRCPGCGYRADQHNRGRSCAVMQHLGPLSV